MNLKSTNLSPIERVILMVGALSSAILFVWQAVTTHGV